MMLDKNTTLSDAQDLAQAAGTYLSTNVYDQGAAATDTLGNTIPKDLGKEFWQEILVQVVETFTSAGAATLQVNIVTGSTSTPATVIQSSAAIALATLVAGYQFKLALPAGLTDRYLGVQYVIGTATTTAGKCTAALVQAKQTAPGH